MRRLAIALLWVVGVPVALAMLSLLALQIPAVQEQVLARALARLNEQLRGELSVAGLRLTDWNRLSLSGVELVTQAGESVGSVRVVSATIDVGAVFAGSLRLGQVRASGLRLDLGRLDTQQGGLLGTLPIAADGPAPEPSPSPAKGSPLLRIEIASVMGPELTARFAPQQRFAMTDFEVAGNVQVLDTGGVVVELASLTGALQRNGQRVARLDSHPQAPGSERRPASQLALTGTLEVEPTSRLRLDARAILTHVDGQSLAALGVDADGLPLPFDARVQVEGLLGRLSFVVELSPQGDGGAQRLWATAAGELELHPERGPPPQVRARLSDGRLDGQPLPVGKLALRVERSGGVVLERLHLSQAGATLRASGRLRQDGAIEGRAALRADQLGDIPFLAAQVPELRGRIAADARVTRAVGGPPRMSLSANGSALSLGAQRAGRWTLDATLAGALGEPDVDASLRATDLRLAGRSLRAVSGTLASHGARLTLSLRSEHDDLSVQGWVSARGTGYRGELRARLNAPHGVLAAHGGFDLQPGDGVRILDARVRYGDAHAHVDGRVDLAQDRSDLRVRARVPALRALLPDDVPDAISGRVRLRARVRGPIAQPRVDAVVDLARGPALLGQPATGHLEATLDLRTGHHRAELHAHVGDGSDADLSLRARLRPGIPDRASLMGGRYEVAIDVNGLPARDLADSLPSGSVPFAGDVEGAIDARIEASGRPRAPTIMAEVDSELRFTGDDGPARFVLDGRYAPDGATHSRLRVTDARGRLVDLTLDAELPREQLRRDPAEGARKLFRSRWSLSVDLSSRRLWDLPGMRVRGQARALYPWRVAANGKIEHLAGHEPEGRLSATLQWLPRAADIPQAGPCALADHLRGQLQATLRDGRLSSQLELLRRARRVASVDLVTRAPMAGWLELEQMALGPARLRAQLERVQLETVPLLCEQASGRVSASLSGHDLFNDAARLALSGELSGVALRQRAPVDGRFAVRDQDERLSFDIDLNMSKTTGEAHLSGELPIDIRVEKPGVCVDEHGPIAANVSMRQIAVEPLLFGLPMVGNASGTVSGDLSVEGRLVDPRVFGRLQLSQVSVTLPEIGQRFSRVTGSAALDGRTLKVDELHLRDRGGTASVSAEVTLASLDRWSGELRLDADDFPLRKSGIFVGTVDARGRVTADASPEKTTIRARIESLSAQLTNPDLDVQGLEENPDIVFESELGQDGASTVEPTDASPGREVLVGVTTARPVWITRDDFSIEAEADLQLRPQPNATSVTGSIELRRGFIELLGQSFDLESGVIRFTGAADPDPQLEITASHDNPDGGQTRVEVAGFVSSPELQFFVDGEAVTAGQALAAILGQFGSGGGTADGADAQAQLNSMALGVTMGLLTLGVRRQVGEWMPRLAVRQTSSGTQVAAGLEASRVIPEFLRGVVRGAYVEGIVSTDGGAAQESGGASAQGASAGLLLELLFPYDLVWASEYGPGARWGVDLDWRP